MSIALEEEKLEPEAAEELPGPDAEPDDEAAAGREGWSPPARRGARMPRAWLTILCAALAVAGFAGTGYFGKAWLAQRSSNAELAQVRSTAAGFVTALTNFDPGTVDADFGRIQSYATGSFATQARQFFGSSIRQQLETAGAASRGQVEDLFSESMSGSAATVFAVVDQTYLNDKLTSAAADTLRLELSMTDGASGWKISAVTVVQSPAGFPSTSGSNG
jgi:hypothetical protein